MDAPDQITAEFPKRQAPAVKTKECNVCGRFLPLSDFPKDGDKYRPNCKVCHGNKYVVCGGCKEKRPETDMKIYTVRVERDIELPLGKKKGKYHCSQTCKNIADGVLRDVNGFIRVWL